MDWRRACGRGFGSGGSEPQLQPGTVHSASTLLLSLRLGTGGCCVCVVRVGRRSVGGRRDDCESLRGAVVESLRDSG